jgi:hypothetical protein
MDGDAMKALLRTDKVPTMSAASASWYIASADTPQGFVVERAGGGSYESRVALDAQGAGCAAGAGEVVPRQHARVRCERER